jgi:hypothetical protein
VLLALLLALLLAYCGMQFSRVDIANIKNFQPLMPGTIG